MRVASFARARILTWRIWQASRARIRVESEGPLARVWGSALSKLLPLVVRRCSRKAPRRSDVVLLGTSDVEQARLHFPLGLYKQTVTELVPRGVGFVHLVTADRGLTGRLIGLDADALHATEPNTQLLVVCSQTQDF